MLCLLNYDSYSLYVFVLDCTVCFIFIVFSMIYASLYMAEVCLLNKITCSNGAGPLVATASNSPLFDTFHWLNINVHVADAFRHVAEPAFEYIMVSCFVCARPLCLLANSVFCAKMHYSVLGKVNYHVM